MPRAKKPEEEHCQKISISFDPEMLQRMMKYCNDDERTFSYAVRKALDQWLKERGY